MAIYLCTVNNIDPCPRTLTLEFQNKINSIRLCFVCAFNSVVCAQILPKLFNFQNRGGLGTCLTHPHWKFGTKLTSYVCALLELVCAFNPVVYAQSLPKISNFESQWLKCNPSYSILSCESDQNCQHFYLNNFYS